MIIKDSNMQSVLRIVAFDSHGSNIHPRPIRIFQQQCISWFESIRSCIQIFCQENKEYESRNCDHGLQENKKTQQENKPNKYGFNENLFIPTPIFNEKYKESIYTNNHIQ
jgi:hypothetical protein